jgi:hypothetical protein
MYVLTWCIFQRWPVYQLALQYEQRHTSHYIEYKKEVSLEETVIHKFIVTFSKSLSKTSSFLASNCLTSYLALNNLPHNQSLSLPLFVSHVQKAPHNSGESVRKGLKTSGQVSLAISLSTAPG